MENENNLKKEDALRNEDKLIKTKRTSKMKMTLTYENSLKNEKDGDKLGLRCAKLSLASASYMRM